MYGGLLHSVCDHGDFPHGSIATRLKCSEVFDDRATANLQHVSVSEIFWRIAQHMANSQEDDC